MTETVSYHRRADQVAPPVVAPRPASWTTGYLRRALLADGSCALAAALLAFQIRFGEQVSWAWTYLLLTPALPPLWLASVRLAGGYDSRFIGVGSDEFRRVLNAGVCLTAAVAIVAYAVEGRPGPRIRGARAAHR